MIKVNFILTCHDSGYNKPVFNINGDIVNLEQISEDYYISFETDDIKQGNQFLNQFDISEYDLLVEVLNKYDESVLELHNLGDYFSDFFTTLSYVYFSTLVEKFELDEEDFELREEILDYLDSLIYYDPIPDGLVFSHLHKVYIENTNTKSINVLYTE